MAAKWSSTPRNTCKFISTWSCFALTVDGRFVRKSDLPVIGRECIPGSGSSCVKRAENLFQSRFITGNARNHRFVINKQQCTYCDFRSSAIDMHELNCPNRPQIQLLKCPDCPRVFKTRNKLHENAMLVHPRTARLLFGWHGDAWQRLVRSEYSIVLH